MNLNTNFYLEVERIVQQTPHAVALETGEGRVVSYAQLDQAVARFACNLRALGVDQGDRVLVQVEKSPDALFLYLACLRSGVVYVPLNTAYQKSELAYFLTNAQPKLVICRTQSQAMFEQLIGNSDCECFTLNEQGGGSFTDDATKSESTWITVATKAADPAVVIYTSGTTGRSKGAVVTHRNLTSNARVLIAAWGFTADDVLLHALPIFHVHGLFVANHCALLSGARMIWHAKFDPLAVVRDLPSATVFMGVPTFYVRLLEHSGFDRNACGNMRLFISGSAPLLAETFRAFEARSRHRILERYGMSEAGMITSNPLHGERRAGTVGRPLDGVEVRVVDTVDHTLASGETGAIQVRGANVFAGYWRMLERTQEEFTADGFFCTGDLGVFDADGYLSIVGRAKDLIISGGYNVYPKEVELALDDIPGIAESAVIGIPDADFGEAVTAVIVARPGASLDEQQIIAQLKAQLANYKIPKRVFVLDELPRNAMGKVQKAALRARFAPPS